MGLTYHQQTIHDLLNRLFEHGKINMPDKTYQFRSKQIHSGKYLLKAYKKCRCVGYWYITANNGALQLDHGNNLKALKDSAKIYFNQFSYPCLKSRLCKIK